MARAHNFSAGPAVLPVSVLEELAGSILEYGKTGLGIMEMSHRSKAFEAILNSAIERLRRILGVPKDYTILFIQGGASFQFYMTALNLLCPGEDADFLVTGVWAKKALAEAKRVSNAAACWDGKATNYDRLPLDGNYPIRESAQYVHYTTNNTIYGTQFPGIPAHGGKPVVADMSSDIASRPVDVAAHELIYAGAQKNLGPSGVTVVILSPWAMERSGISSAARGGLPSMIDYTVFAKENSLYNTPNTWGIFALERVLAWVESEGGPGVIAARNTEKAELLYAELDRSGYWRPHAARDVRSAMNITWRGPSEALEAQFVAEAEAAGFKGLKGHRSVGGLRASQYNALPLESVEALVGFMRAFEAKNG